MTRAGVEICRERRQDATSCSSASLPVCSLLHGDNMTNEEPADMTKPGPSPAYRDLLNGKITPEEYLEKMKREVDEKLRERPPERRDERAGAAA